MQTDQGGFHSNPHMDQCKGAYMLLQLFSSAVIAHVSLGVVPQNGYITGFIRRKEQMSKGSKKGSSAVEHVC